MPEAEEEMVFGLGARVLLYDLSRPLNLGDWGRVNPQVQIWCGRLLPEVRIYPDTEFVLFCSL